MTLSDLNEVKDTSKSEKLSKIYIQFQNILGELKKRELPDETIGFINKDIAEINTTPYIDKDLVKLLRKKLTKIIRILEKELKIVPKGYYKVLWSSKGICIFGLPVGIIFGLIIMNNAGYLPIGFPFGMLVGRILGSSMDKKAFEEGRQLDVNIWS